MMGRLLEEGDDFDSSGPPINQDLSCVSRVTEELIDCAKDFFNERREYKSCYTLW
jgi:hypothetical protein